jgi:hypothetical protein
MLRFVLFLLFLGPCLQAAADGLFQETAQIEERLSAITGLAFKHTVPYAVINRAQLHTYLDTRVKESLKPEDVRVQETILKMLGLVPKDFDLRTTMVDLLTEQAAAFYDYHKKKLFLLENNSDPDSRLALVHELAHALADQHFRLNKYIQDGARSDDSETARLAVMEGQASWLMTAYMSDSKSGIPPAVLQTMRDALSDGGSQFPVYSKAPLYIRVSLVFPYADGLMFQDALYHRYGRDSFSRVFRDPPLNTHQILHPEAYGGPPPPRSASPPVPPDRKHLRLQAEGTLGELDLRVLLTQTVGKEEGEAEAAHLANGAYAYYENKRSKRPVLTFVTSWDTPEAASRFLGLYRKALARKWTKLEILLDKDTGIEGEGDSGHFRVMLDGALVTSMEGLPNSVN